MRIPCGGFSGHPSHPLNGATTEYFSSVDRYRWLDMNAKPPATMDMTLREAPFRAFKSGRKRVELRLCDYKHRWLRIGDSIRFRLEETDEYHWVTVTGIRYFPDFEALYAELIPVLGAEALGYAEGEVPDPADMLAYYPQEMVRYHGVMAIETV